MKSDLHIYFPKSHLLATKKQSRDLDEKTIQDFDIQGITLMEIAGEKASSIIAEKQGDDKKQYGIFYCGKGNNGGDALVAARYLADQYGHHTTVVLCAEENELSNDTGRNLARLKKLSERNKHIRIVRYSDLTEANTYAYQVDGLIGTGLSSDLRNPLKSIVDQINKNPAPLYSLDIPTGLDADTGRIFGSALKADYTITFGTNKVGFYLNSGPDLTGEVRHVELPFPSYLHPDDTVLVDEHLYKQLPPVNRLKADHKYQKGTVHIVAGSEGLTGAAILAAKSAWNSGAGAVFLYAPKKLLSIYEIALPQIIKIPVGDEKDSYFKPSHVSRIVKNLGEKEGILLLGPGIGTKKETIKFGADLMQQFDGQAVIDADGLAAWSTIRNFPSSKLNRWILTPHPGELKKYIDADFSDDHERLMESKKIVGKYGINLLSKGHPTILAGSDQKSYITGYNTRLFSRAGEGDILAGTIATKLAVTNSTSLAILSALIDGLMKLDTGSSNTENSTSTKNGL